MAKQASLQLNPDLTPYRRKPYEPENPAPFMVSRSKVDLFMECPRCAYLDLRLGIKRPQTPTFTINNAIDKLFKREFDTHRAAGNAHPLMETYKIDAVPFVHKLMDNWRENFVGVQHHHQPTNLVITGAVDDIWQYPNGELIVVDYKATAKSISPSKVSDLYDSYKRQMEIYQWLLRQNDFEVSNTGYFVYANGRTDVKAFDGKLEFDINLIPYDGDDSWIESELIKLKALLSSDSLPQPGKAFNGGPCDYCSYAEKRTKITLKAIGNQ